jgi:hypothetical protein
MNGPTLDDHMGAESRQTLLLVACGYHIFDARSWKAIERERGREGEILQPFFENSVQLIL